MKTSDNGIKLLKQFEGCRLTAYRLAGEKYNTIGYGHYGADVKDGQTITQAQAENYLRQDLVKYENYVEKYVRDIQLNQNQFDALVSYTYNRGAGGIKQLSENCHTVSQYSEGIVKYWGSATRYKDALIRRRKQEKTLFDTPMNNSKEQTQTANTGQNSQSQTTTKTTSKAPYRVQCGAFSDKNKAEKLQKQIKAKGFDTLVVKSGGYWKVQCGAYKTTKYADVLVEKLKKNGFDAIVVIV